MQGIVSLENIALILIILGFLMIFIGILSSVPKSDSEDSQYTSKSKGVIFIGPIPIVWGFEKRTRNIIIIVGLTLILIWFLLTLF